MQNNLKEEIKESNSPLQSLTTVNQFCEKNKAFTKGGVRHVIFYAKTNGLKKSGALIRMGRRVLINEEKFFEWLEAQNKKGNN